MSCDYRALKVSVDWIVLSASMVSTTRGLKIFEKSNACAGHIYIFLFFLSMVGWASTQHCIVLSEAGNSEGRHFIPGDGVNGRLLEKTDQSNIRESSVCRLRYLQGCPGTNPLWLWREAVTKRGSY